MASDLSTTSQWTRVRPETKPHRRPVLTSWQRDLPVPAYFESASERLSADLGELLRQQFRTLSSESTRSGWSALERELVAGLPEAVALLAVSSDPSPSPRGYYAIVEDHERESGDALSQLELRLLRRYADLDFELHVFAHQDRDPRSAVPRGTVVIYARHG